MMYSSLSEAEQEIMGNGEDAAGNEDWVLANQLIAPLYVIHPNHPAVMETEWFVRSNMGLWDEFQAITDKMINTTERLRAERDVCVGAWRSLILPFTPKQQLSIAEITCEIAYPLNVPVPVFPRSKQKKYDPTKPIRIGILSADLRDHPVGVLIRAWIMNHDPSKTQLIALSLGNDDGPDENGVIDETINTKIRRDLLEAFDEFYDLTEEEYENDEKKICRFIRSKDIHVLIDCSGHTQGARLDVLMKKPAPVIVAWLGHAGPMGTRCHDYVIVDETIAPFPSSVKCYSEKLAYIEPSYFIGNHRADYPYMNYTEQVYTSEKKMIVLCGEYKIPMEILSTKESTDRMWAVYSDKQDFVNIGKYKLINGAKWNGEWPESWQNIYIFNTRDEYKLPDNAVVFMTFNQIVKLCPAVFDQWIMILQGVENAVLWVGRYPGIGLTSIIAYTENQYGPAMAARIIPATWAPTKESHVRRLGLGDFSIEGGYFGGHTTSYDAVSANKPILGINGETFASNVACSHLIALNMSECIANSWSEFVSKGIAFGNDREKIRELSLKIQAQKPTCPLWDGPRFANQMERVTRIMYSTYKNGHPPNHIVSPIELEVNPYSLESITFGDAIVNGFYKGKFKETTKVSVKTKQVSTNNWDDIFLEFKILSRLNHPAVLNLIGAFWKVDAYFVHEFFATNLQSILKNRELTHEQGARFVIQMLIGLDYIHQLNILHRNINTSNMVVNHHGNLKMSGFNDAFQCVQIGKYIVGQEEDGFLPVNPAPEVHRSQEVAWYSTKSDIFAAGVVAFEIFKTERPFFDNRPATVRQGTPIHRLQPHEQKKYRKTTRSRTVEVQKVSLEERLSEVSNAFSILSMLQYEPENRLSCSELLTLFQESTRFSMADIFDENPDRSQFWTHENDTTPYVHKNPPAETDESKALAQFMERFYFDSNKPEEATDDIQNGDSVIVQQGYYESEKGVVQSIHPERGVTMVKVRFPETEKVRMIPIVSLQKL